MRNITLGILVLCFLCAGAAAQNQVPQRLADVKSVYVDERSFTFWFSSCGSKAGGMLLVCPEHNRKRAQFLIALKRWVGKSGFALAPDRDDADAILQGTLSIADRPPTDIPYPDKLDRDRKSRSLPEPQWSVRAWAVNRNGTEIWKLGYEYPAISYGVSGRPKIEGKRLAKALEYDRRKRR
jgi:hypothetical protein